MTNPTTIQKLVFFVFAFLFLPPDFLFCQDLSDLNQHKQTQINGNMSFDQMITPSMGVGSYSPAQPHSWFLSGGLNTSFLGISIPLNFSYTNQELGFSHPFTFNQFGAQPSSYKWVRTYIGYNTLSLSPYTLAGHQFMGAGAALNPPGTPLSVSLVYGRQLRWKTPSL